MNKRKKILILGVTGQDGSFMAKLMYEKALKIRNNNYPLAWLSLGYLYTRNYQKFTGSNDINKARECYEKARISTQ